MVSRWLVRVGAVLLLCFALSMTASAQYGGGGTGMPGSTGSGSGSGYSYGHAKAIGIGVGAGAAAVVGTLLYLHHRHKVANAARSQASIIGCTTSAANGISLKDESDGDVYTVITSGTPLQAGQHVELTGVTDRGPGARTFIVRGPVRSFGTCDSTATASATKPTSAKTAAAN